MDGAIYLLFRFLLFNSADKLNLLAFSHLFYILFHPPTSFSAPKNESILYFSLFQCFYTAQFYAWHWIIGSFRGNSQNSNEFLFFMTFLNILLGAELLTYMFLAIHNVIFLQYLHLYTFLSSVWNQKSQCRSKFRLLQGFAVFV